MLNDHGDTHMYKRILAPIDGSETSDFAAQEAIRLAVDQHADLRFIHVMEEAYLPYTEGYIDIAVLRDAVRQQGHRILSKSTAFAAQAGLRCEQALLEAHGERTSRIIIDDAEQWNADVIVMGTHGRRGLDHMIFGSLAEGVVRFSPLPILLVRGGKEKR